jgi:dTDP-glucose 4,6-dehydratase
MSDNGHSFAGAVAVVTGGGGFLGSHVCEELLRRGAEVVCLDNFATGRRSNIAQLPVAGRFTLLEHDVVDPLPPEAPAHADYVLHMASAASPSAYQKLPIETLEAGSIGTQRMLDYAHRSGARFVMASTSEVYGDPHEHPQRETYWGNVNPIGVRSVYDEAKRFAEALSVSYRRHRRTNTAIARIFNTYGPRMRRDDGRLVPTVITQALRGEPMTISGAGTQSRSLCYVSDTVAGLLALATSTHPGPVNIGNPVEMQVLEIAAAVRELSGSDSPITHIEAAEDDPQRRCPDITLARNQLGWAPRVDLRDGLAKTIEWFADELERAA